MTANEIGSAIAVLEKAGYTVLAPAEAKAIQQVLPMLTEDEIRFVLGRATASLNAALRKFGLA